MKNNFLKNNKGFSLIELIVALGIFTSIITVLLGALIVTMNAARNSRALRTAMDNVNFATESMTRSIRMGTNYYCVEGSILPSMTNNPSTNDCDDGTFVAFVPQGEDVNGSRVGYGLIEDEKEGKSVLKRCTGDDSCVAIVSPDVNVEDLKFVVTGSGLKDNRQASVYIIMKGTVLVKGAPVSFAIQTMASQRNFQ